MITIVKIENRMNGHVMLELSDGSFVPVHRGEHMHLVVGDPWPESMKPTLRADEKIEYAHSANVHAAPPSGPPLNPEQPLPSASDLDAVTAEQETANASTQQGSAGNDGNSGAQSIETVQEEPISAQDVPPAAS